jgi:hypothetical protein
MNVKLNRPSKPEESQKNANFNGKTIPYPGLEPATFELAFGSHNHCTIGSVFCWVTRSILVFETNFLEHQVRCKLVEIGNEIPNLTLIS